LLFHAKQALVMLFSAAPADGAVFAERPGSSSSPTESPAARLVVAALHSFLAQPSTGSTRRRRGR
jgi:hypothetical protein